ncbi:hypothetical protein SESBI_37848 [Sesbania bispinosa]|nr:hypothetical protein SESBI_37848 [Sesbania bispinosa]
MSEKREDCEKCNRVSNVRKPQSGVGCDGYQNPNESIFEELCKVGAIEKKRDSRKGAMCAIHPDAEHSIEKCEKFKEVLQSLIDSQLVQISCERDEMGVNVVQESENAQTQVFPKVPTPLTLHGTHNTQAPTCHGPRPITIQVPSPFPYKNSKAVPWKYDVQVELAMFKETEWIPQLAMEPLLSPTSQALEE